jgi:hypothetical protein
MSRDSSVSIIYRLRTVLPGNWFYSRQGKDFFSFHNVRTCSGTQAVSYSIDVGPSFPGGKFRRREADYAPPSSVEVMDAWRYASAPP